ncbi:hypothetical protein NUU61_003490 [Penicillium alfredii]|uniref:Endoplasmic reticulum junction formation protein lunapark n=1 Tax=Penicillium alfredii TaxID=1506179 RepID=A0A9W9FJH8_9EURO|nr:uncharacterized protein NUU61_003490 [Penicillium alfredii]KAJ5101268.1 hypothetical protein NUU61_003490 [Penicillium alfredii]
MVSLWPWKGEDNSPASFEKTLSTLSSKIAQASSRLDQHRQASRRFKALWTLYSTFAYLFYSIILALVLGWDSWGVKEYAAIVGGPVLIYAVRSLGARLFDYRISRIQHRLDDFQKQREETIEKLKVATKYNSTQQLLEKYGGESPKPASPKPDNVKQKPATPQPPVARTGLPPPPTANIRRPPPAPAPNPSAQPPSYEIPAAPQPPRNASPAPVPGPSFPPTDEPGFAPNAFPNQGQYIEQPHWYDRLLDVLLGEDETQPRNRMAMVCGSCRLVNGQAPPGINTPEELGRWRCGSCGAWNGIESETTKILTSLRADRVPSSGTWEAPSRVEPVPQPAEALDDEVDVTPSDDDQSVSRPSDEPQETPSDSPEEDSQPEPVRRSKRNGAKTTE